MTVRCSSRAVDVTKTARVGHGGVLEMATPGPIPTCLVEERARARSSPRGATLPPCRFEPAC